MDNVPVFFLNFTYEIKKVAIKKLIKRMLKNIKQYKFCLKKSLSAECNFSDSKKLVWNYNKSCINVMKLLKKVPQFCWGFILIFLAHFIKLNKMSVTFGRQIFVLILLQKFIFGRSVPSCDRIWINILQFERQIKFRKRRISIAHTNGRDENK